MTTLDTTARKGGADSKDFVILPSDVYRMKILKTVIEENRFAEPLNDGTKPLQLVITWEITQLSDEQTEGMVEAEEDWDTAQVWQRINPYYGDVRAGGPSKFKAFVDMLCEQGHLKNFDPGAFDIETLVGIEQRVNVEKYIKSQGENVGKPGNKVVSVLPLKRTKNGKKEAAVPAGVVEENDLPF